MLGRVHITTGNPLKNLMEFHLSKESGLIDLQIKTALINDLDPYLGNHLHLEGKNLDARNVTGSMYQQHGDEGFCISGGQGAGAIRLLAKGSNGVGGGSGFKAGTARNVIWTLPNADGSSGQVLSTDGNQNLSWITGGGGGGGSGTVTSVATFNGTFVNITGGDPSPITTTGTISGDLSATGTASSSTFLRGDNTWAVPAGTAPAGSSYEVQMRAVDGTFGATGIFATTSGELQFGSASGTEVINLNAADSIIAFDNFPSGEFKQGLEFYYGYRIVESAVQADLNGLSFVKEEGGSDHCIMDVFSQIPFVGGDLRSVSIGHSHHKIDGNFQTGTYLDIDGLLLLRGADPASDDTDYVSLKAQTGSEGYEIGFPTSAYTGHGYRKNMAMCIKTHTGSTGDLDWKNVLITNENNLCSEGDTGLFLKGENAVSGTNQSNPINNGDVIHFVAGGGTLSLDYTVNGLGGGASSTHTFTFTDSGGGGGGSGTVTSVATSNGSFVDITGGTITTSGTITGDLSASGTADSTTFLRGDNTWAVPAGGGGGGSGTVTSVATSSGTFVNVTGGTITSSGTITSDLSATGTASSSTFLRGDNTWAVPSGGGGGMSGFYVGSGTGNEVTDGGSIHYSSFDSSIVTTVSNDGMGVVTVEQYVDRPKMQFDMSDGSNSFTVEDSTIVDFQSSDGSVTIDLSSTDTVDLTTGSTPPPPSDERLKENIESVGGLLEKVEKLKPVEFDWNDEAASTFKKEGHEIGLIAQDVEKIFPDLVGDRKGFKTVDYEKLVPMLVDCIKDLSHQVRTLNEKVDDLEFRNLTDQ